MKMKTIAMLTAGFMLASGSSLLAMGNRNNNERGTGMGSRDDSYSSGVSTSRMMRGSGVTNGVFGTGSDMGTRGMDTDNGSGSGARGTGTGTGAANGNGAGTGTRSSGAGAGSGASGAGSSF